MKTSTRKDTTQTFRIAPLWLQHYIDCLGNEAGDDLKVHDTSGRGTRLTASESVVDDMIDHCIDLGSRQDEIINKRFRAGVLRSRHAALRRLLEIKAKFQEQSQ